MGNLKEILNQYKATPSADGWEKLSQRLDIVMPAGETPTATAQSSVGKGIWTSTASKVVTAVAAVAAAGTVAILAVTRHGQQPELTEPASSEPVIIREDTLSTQPDTLYLDTLHTNTLHRIETSTTTPKANKPEVVVTMAPDEPLIASEPTPHMPIQNQVFSTPNSSLLPAAATPTSKAPSDESKINPETMPARSVIAEQTNNDPVVQNYADEVSWEQPVKIVIPNVFTPNGDGYNDRFVILGAENSNKRQLIIRNRAGKIVYRNNAYENTWDGDSCPEGVYTYQFTFHNGSFDQTLSGTVTIVR